MKNKETIKNKLVETPVPISVSIRSVGPGSSMKDIKRKKIILIQDWCECGNPDFLCYPEDDGCSCGMAKHHVHCKCGGILQVG
jgi:hypothetical protein